MSLKIRSPTASSCTLAFVDIVTSMYPSLLINEYKFVGDTLSKTTFIFPPIVFAITGPLTSVKFIEP